MKTIVSSLGILILAACSGEVGHGSHEHEEGQHGGTMLEDDHFALEVSLFERGVPPEFRIYAFNDGKPIPPAEVELELELIRFGGGVEHFSFTSQEDYLLGNRAVGEPHSFDVSLRARYAGESHEWNYESHEGRTTISAEMATRAGVETATAGPGELHETLTLYGTVEASPDKRLHVTPRFPGVIRTVLKNLGDEVRKGEILATVESNESLQIYSVTSPIAGILTERKANPGERVGSDPLFEIIDFSSVVAEVTVFPGHHARLARGQRVRVRATTTDVAGEGAITSLTPVHQTAVPTWVARITLPNEDRRWSPGLFVTAEVTISETQVPIAIPQNALQKIRDRDVVFLNARDTYQAQPLVLGRRDGEKVEVLSGLVAGDRYVVRNSYLIKADIEKSGASHDH